MESWDVNYSLLKDYQLPTWDGDQFHEIGKGKYGIFFYGITEMRMCSYGSKIALYHNKQHPEILFNPDSWFSFQFERTFYYMPLSKCLVLRSLVYGNADIIPYLIVDLDNWKIAYVYWDYTSINIEATEVSKGKILFKSITSSFFDNASKQISFDNLDWFSFNELEKASIRLEKPKDNMPFWKKVWSSIINNPPSKL